jgi:SAM-dependent methyltransferase/glycosyltransferase involved in cell wall biosynthesis
MRETAPHTNEDGPCMPEIGVIAMVPDPWNSWWQPRHHVLSKLAEYFHVVWVNPAHDWHEALKSWSSESSEDADISRPPGLVVYEPGFWLPKVYSPKWFARCTFGARLKHARRLLTSRGCRKIVLYLWRPEFAPALNSIPFDMSCYHIDDEYSFSEVELPPDPAEMALIANVNQVVIHSHGLLDRKGAINPNTVFIPNGVDFEAYAKAAPEPGDLSAIPHPRIGYSGFIKKQLDWPLILALTSAHPEWSFVFVGPCSPHPEIAPIVQELSCRRNVHFLGGKSLPDLAAYSQHFDVCIMPYRVDGYTNQIYPLKMHEYLAGGQPVVGSPIRSLCHFSNVIALAASADEWDRALANALQPASRCPDAVAGRRTIAAAHDWGRLVYSLAGTLCDRLGPEESEQFSKLTSNNGRGESSEALSAERHFKIGSHSYPGSSHVTQDDLRVRDGGTLATAARLKNKLCAFLIDPHFPFFLLTRIRRIWPALARYLRYGRYNPNTESYWNKRYGSGEYEASEAKRYQDLHIEITRLVPSLSRVLDLGCGTGRLMDTLRNQGCSCVGVDISGVAVSMVQQKGFPAFRSKLPDLPHDLEENSFDVCMIVETLEHLSNPAKTLENVSKVLKKESGSVIVCVPDDCMKPEEFDEHVFSFTSHTFHQLMSRYYKVDLSFSIESGGYPYLIVKGKRL